MVARGPAERRARHAPEASSVIWMCDTHRIRLVRGLVVMRVRRERLKTFQAARFLQVLAAFERFLEPLRAHVRPTKMKALKDRVAASLSWVGPCLKFFTWVGGIAAVVYLLFLLRLGQFTLAQHVRRIWQTQEVGDLRSGIATKLASTRNNAVRGIRAKLETTREPGEGVR